MDKKVEKLDAALIWAQRAHREALARKRAAGEPRNPLRGKPGQEEAFAAAEQEAAVTATILAALRRAKEAEPEPEKGHPVREYLQLFFWFCAATGGGALAGLGLSLIAHRLAVPLAAVLAVLAALTLGFILWKRRG